MGIYIKKRKGLVCSG
ncbi:hypothetical protein K5I22_19205 [Clostridia bacterium UC5.1-1D4]|nr:hypothetical protein K5I22_19205 [Clostridia bacterium UC5.1-1D4]